MNILIFGASGLLGNAMFRVLCEKNNWNVFGTIRNPEIRSLFSFEFSKKLVVCGDLEDHDELVRVFDQIKPDVVINCLSIAKDILNKSEPLKVLSIYSLLPHRLSRLCSIFNARLVHISSDGVFSGAAGKYTEDDLPDAADIYGVSKLLGEVYHPHAISLRTSIIGHEINTSNGLLEWFLSQKGQCKCYTRSIFSGLPTVALAQIVRDVVIPQSDLYGVYHVAANPISKYDLLQLIADVYGKSIELIPDDQVVIDRSLNTERFRMATGYAPPNWPELIKMMHAYR